MGEKRLYGVKAGLELLTQLNAVECGADIIAI